MDGAHHASVIAKGRPLDLQRAGRECGGSLVDGLAGWRPRHRRWPQRLRPERRVQGCRSRRGWPTCRPRGDRRGPASCAQPGPLGRAASMAWATVSDPDCWRSSASMGLRAALGQLMRLAAERYGPCNGNRGSRPCRSDRSQCPPRRPGCPRCRRRSRSPPDARARRRRGRRRSRCRRDVQHVADGGGGRSPPKLGEREHIHVVVYPGRRAESARDSLPDRVAVPRRA